MQSEKQEADGWASKPLLILPAACCLLLPPIRSALASNTRPVIV